MFAPYCCTCEPTSHRPLSGNEHSQLDGCACASAVIDAYHRGRLDGSLRDGRITGGERERERRRQRRTRSGRLRRGHLRRRCTSSQARRSTCAQAEGRACDEGERGAAAVLGRPAAPPERAPSWKADAQAAQAASSDSAVLMPDLVGGKKRPSASLRMEPIVRRLGGRAGGAAAGGRGAACGRAHTPPCRDCASAIAARPTRP